MKLSKAWIEQPSLNNTERENILSSGLTTIIFIIIGKNEP